MKKIFYILLIFSFVTTNAQIDKSIDLNWHTNFDEAKQMANSQDKLILIYFTGSDWSQPCKLLNQDFFYTEKFQQIAKETFSFSEGKFTQKTKSHFRSSKK